jgi:signal transduction histidine kinase
VLADVSLRGAWAADLVLDSHVETSAEGGPATVLADAPRTRQVLTNLISNAIKFSPEGAEVTVSWITTESRVACAVADRGMGIPADSRDRIFEKFHQLAPSALSGMRGIGLGLAIARKIVEAHGGRLWVDCPPEGGSIFRFSLPVHAAPAPLHSLEHANG